jgi:hypothetical protein
MLQSCPALSNAAFACPFVRWPVQDLATLGAVVSAEAASALFKVVLPRHMLKLHGSAHGAFADFHRLKVALLVRLKVADLPAVAAVQLAVQGPEDAIKEQEGIRGPCPGVGVLPMPHACPDTDPDGRSEINVPRNPVCTDGCRRSARAHGATFRSTIQSEVLTDKRIEPCTHWSSLHRLYIYIYVHIYTYV